MKPMLLSNDEFNLEDLDYSLMFESPKRDGVRAEVTNKGLLGRSLKPIANVKVQAWFKEVYENLPDGVIVEAEIHCDTLPCREIAGIVNSDAHDVPKDFKLYIFGLYDKELSFIDRYNKLITICKKYMKGDRFELVEQHQVRSAKEARAKYESYLKKGLEGMVLMCGTKKYKSGRVTIKQHIGFKVKPKRTDDLEIIGVTERFLNTNESLTNELGNSYKRNTVDAKEATGIAATFICKLPNGEETKVTLTGDEDFRREIWKNRKKYIGKYAVCESMDYGVKDKLRHPTLLDIKDAEEK